jgi:hypothetical protein
MAIVPIFGIPPINFGPSCPRAGAFFACGWAPVGNKKHLERVLMLTLFTLAIDDSKADVCLAS